MVINWYTSFSVKKVTSSSTAFGTVMHCRLLILACEKTLFAMQYKVCDEGVLFYGVPNTVQVLITA